MNAFIMCFEIYCRDKYKKKRKTCWTRCFCEQYSLWETLAKHVQKPFWNECILHVFWHTFWKKVWKKMQKRVFSAIFTLVNACKTRGETVFKLMHFASVLRHFVETSFEKKRAKNSVFESNFHFGKCVENTSKNNFKMHAFCMSFETLCGDK